MLTARTDHLEYVEAAEAHRTASYRCRGCGRRVILKRGRKVVAHFAHEARTACAFGRGISPAHLSAQQSLAVALRARDAHVELEAWLRGLSGDRRIDILAFPRGRPDRRVAIEIQHSTITEEAIAGRTLSYWKGQVAPLWVRLLDFGRFKRVQRLPHGGQIWIEHYVPRSWERWAHQLLAGLWFCDSGTGLFWRGQFLQGYRTRYSVKWYGPGEAMRSGLTFVEPVDTFVRVALEGPFPATSLHVNRGTHKGRLVAWLVPPREVEQRGLPLLKLAERVGWRNGDQIQIVEHLEEGKSIEARYEDVRSDWRWTDERRLPADHFDESAVAQ